MLINNGREFARKAIAAAKGVNPNRAKALHTNGTYSDAEYAEQLAAARLVNQSSALEALASCALAAGSIDQATRTQLGHLTTRHFEEFVPTDARTILTQSDLMRVPAGAVIAFIQLLPGVDRNTQMRNRLLVHSMVSLGGGWAAGSFCKRNLRIGRSDGKWEVMNLAQALNWVGFNPMAEAVSLGALGASDYLPLRLRYVLPSDAPPVSVVQLTDREAMVQAVRYGVPHSRATGKPMNCHEAAMGWMLMSMLQDRSKMRPPRRSNTYSPAWRELDDIRRLNGDGNTPQFTSTWVGREFYSGISQQITYDRVTNTLNPMPQAGDICFLGDRELNPSHSMVVVEASPGRCLLTGFNGMVVFSEEFGDERDKSAGGTPPRCKIAGEWDPDPRNVLNPGRWISATDFRCSYPAKLFRVSYEAAVQQIRNKYDNWVYASASNSSRSSSISEDSALSSN